MTQKFQNRFKSKPIHSTVGQWSMGVMEREIIYKI